MFSAFEKPSGLPDKHILFVGLGNVLRRDDGVGVYLAQKLLTNQHIRVLNVEVSLENYIGKINAIHPEVLILMDSVDFNRKPGYSALIPAGCLADYTTNTHNVSLARIGEIYSRPHVCPGYSACPGIIWGRTFGSRQKEGRPGGKKNQYFFYLRIAGDFCNFYCYLLLERRYYYDQTTGFPEG